MSRNVIIATALLSAVLLGVVFKSAFSVFSDFVEGRIIIFANSDFVTALASYHGCIKFCLVVLSFIPLFQTFRLLKTRSAKDVSIIYQFFTLIVLTCINIDIFRTQFGKADVNTFIIMCRYGKILFYNVNICLMLYLLKSVNRSTVGVFLGFLLCQFLVLSGIFIFPQFMIVFVNYHIVGVVISVIFAVGILKPTFQMFKTLKCKTANDVSMLYYLAFCLFLLFAIFDSLIMYQKFGIGVPIKTTMANAVKMCLYLLTFLIIFYVRYIFNKKVLDYKKSR